MFQNKKKQFGIKQYKCLVLLCFFRVLQNSLNYLKSIQNVVCEYKIN